MTYIPSLTRASRVPLLVTVLAALAIPDAMAVGNSPARPVPSDRWGTPAQMRPWSILGDSTIYDGHIVPSEATPIWHGMDIAGDYLFTVTGKGVMVHDLRPDPTDPPRLGYLYAANSSKVPNWFQSDQKFYLYDIDAPGDNHELAVTVGSANGVIVWDFRNKSGIDVHYQDYKHGAEQGHSGVWTNTIGGRDYAFTAAGERGVTVYDLTTASTYRRCDTATGGCADVFKGAIPTGASPFAVDGAGHYVAVSMVSKGLEIWNVSNPTSPQRVLAAVPKAFSQYQGIALWQKGASNYYVAVYDGFSRAGTYYTNIFDVSCIATGSCATSDPLANPVAKISSNGFILGLVNDSTDAGRNYLYLGGSGPDTGSGGDQREFILDVTDPGNPVELTPDNPPGKGYWGWYYEGNFTGDPKDGAFESVGPRVAMVHDGYLYRAAFTLLDVHELLGAAPPVADFDWTPTPVYAGQEVTFNDLSGGGPTTWFWQFSGASPSTTQSFLQSPKITFGAIGTAQVTLTSSNDAGAGDPLARTVPVLDPVPTIAGGVSFTPGSPLVCQELVFTANDVAGRPPLAYSWSVKNGSGEQVASGAGNPFSWQTGSATTAGAYVAEVTVTNGTTPATSQVPFSLIDPPQLAIDAGPSTDPFNFGTVQFRSDTTGAASWTWDFGDGNAVCPSGFNKTAAGCTTTDPSKGEDPIYNYSAPGTYTVTLTVANCKHGQQSAQVQVTITQIDPLKITQFQAKSQCQVVPLPGGCFGVNQPVVFDQAVSGTPDLYEYDWNGDGTWDEQGTSRVTSHTYASPGTFVPRMRITRGSEPPVTVAHGCSSESPGCTGTEIVVSPADPPSLSISGPGSGSVNQNLSFTAGASNCAPSRDGWSWTAGGGGVVNGSGQTVTVVWTSSGTKNLSVTNSACPGGKGSKLVSITGPGNGGGDPPPSGNRLDASFSFSPTSPKAGQAVSFDASSSTGNPTGYSWSFGDGGSGSGRIVSHTFQEPGNYAVTLSVSAPGDCPNAVGAVTGICTDTRTTTVRVTPGNSISASFDDGGVCQGGTVGVVICAVGTGEEVTFTDTSQGEVSQRSWDFGDGTSATGKVVTHQWMEPGNYAVTLTVAGGEASSTASRNYQVSGAAVPQVQPVVVPWIAQADPDKALHQTSDLNVHNPGTESLQVRITFRKRGLPEPDPPEVIRTVPAGSTLHVPDAMRGLFDRGNISGFLFVEPIEGSAQPVVTTFNRTFTPDGQSYGQVVPGFPLSNLRRSAEGGTGVLHLVGLNDNTTRQAYFGISNPSDQPLVYTLRFYDSLGGLVGETSESQTLARFGQKQYQVEDIRSDFGVESTDDYRIEIDVADGSPQPFVYGANLRLVSKDPSFLRVGRTDLEELFLVGALNTPGLNDSFFQTDVVLANTGTLPAACDLTFQATGFQTDPTPAFSETIPAMESVRLANVVAEWDVGNSVGVLRIACTGDGVFPVVQGEGYDVSRPDQVYGQFMPALSIDLAAEPGKPHSLVGLRQDEENRTTLWIYNPTDERAVYHVRYFDLEGRELGGETSTPIGAGKFRQLNPGHHPDGIDGGFVVRIEVQSGKLITAAQVVNAANDPAYIVGQ